jgi:hypothetical protein
MTVGVHCGAHEIKLPENNGVSIYNQVSSHLQVVSRSLEFLIDKFRNLSLQEPDLSKVTGLGTGRLSPAPVRVGLINEAQLELGSLGETDTNPILDRADHTRGERLARELDKRKGHNGLQDDSRGTEDEQSDGALTRRNHPKFNS